MNCGNLTAVRIYLQFDGSYEQGRQEKGKEE
jgi:hypothetical protein